MSARKTILDRRTRASGREVLTTFELWFKGTKPCKEKHKEAIKVRALYSHLMNGSRNKSFGVQKIPNGEV